MNGFTAIANRLQAKAHDLVEQTAVTVVTSAKAHSRVKTGAMRDGWSEEMVSATAAVVSNPVTYTPTHEYGSVKITAQPMLHPALDEATPAFEAGLKHLLEP